MALHIQKQEGCRIKKQTPSSGYIGMHIIYLGCILSASWHRKKTIEKNDEKKSRVNELEVDWTVKTREGDKYIWPTDTAARKRTSSIDAYSVVGRYVQICICILLFQPLSEKYSCIRAFFLFPPAWWNGTPLVTQQRQPDCRSKPDSKCRPA